MGDFDFTSIGNMEKNTVYQEFVKGKAEELMNGEENISVDKAISIFKGYNKNVDTDVENKIKQLAASDGNENVSKDEMSAIYALFDMELSNDNKFHFDGDIGNVPNSGMQLATDDEFTSVLNVFKTEEEKLAANAQEQKLKLTEFADKIKHNLYLGDYANMNEIIDEGVFSGEVSFKHLKSKLAEKGIEFTEDSNDKSITYELDNKKYIMRNVDRVKGEPYIVRNGTKEKLNEMGFDLYFMLNIDNITDVYDASGKLVQTVTESYGDTDKENATMTWPGMGSMFGEPGYTTEHTNIIKYDDEGRPVLGLAYNQKTGKVAAVEVRKYNKDNSYLKYYHPRIDQGVKTGTHEYYLSDGTMSSELYGRELE